MPALRSFGNICTESDEITEFAIQLGIIPFLKNLLKHEKKQIAKESAWCLSNIAAGTED